MKTATTFTDWMTRSLDLWPGGCPEARRAEYARLIEGVGAAWAEGPPWRALPALIQAGFGPRGWAWNGIYALRGESLSLFVAAGPPVCQTLDRRGGAGTSGMCWDAVMMNQTIVAADVRRWPGYVSCDGESGLATKAGMVCPIRDVAGAPIAVWDVDSVEPLDPMDGPFFDRVFATLSAVLRPELADFSG